MEKLEKALGIQPKECVSLIGSGGKTSLLWYLAEIFRQQRVLVGPTTKIGMPPKAVYDWLFIDQYPLESAQVGVSLIGSRQLSAKVASAPLDVISRLVPEFDKVLLEADGSKQLPLKGWEAFEPVVIDETTLTIGILPIKALGLVVSEQTVHRLEKFTAITGLAKGQVVDQLAIGKIISHSHGLWAKGRGRHCLFINQIETEEELTQARTMVEGWSSVIFEKLDRVVAGSTKKELGVVLWEKQSVRH